MTSIAAILPDVAPLTVTEINISPDGCYASHSSAKYVLSFLNKDHQVLLSNDKFETNICCPISETLQPSK